jgi:hypothetical protein
VLVALIELLADLATGRMNIGAGDFFSLSGAACGSCSLSMSSTTSATRLRYSSAETYAQQGSGSSCTL